MIKKKPKSQRRTSEKNMMSKRKKPKNKVSLKVFSILNFFLFWIIKSRWKRILHYPCQSAVKIFCKIDRKFVSNMDEEIKNNHQRSLVTIPPLVSETYELENNYIGVGGFGVVLKGRHRQELKEYAIKLISLAEVGLPEEEINEKVKDANNELQIFSSWIMRTSLNIIHQWSLIKNQWLWLAWN